MCLSITCARAKGELLEPMAWSQGFNFHSDGSNKALVYAKVTVRSVFKKMKKVKASDSL